MPSRLVPEPGKQKNFIAPRFHEARERFPLGVSLAYRPSDTAATARISTRPPGTISSETPIAVQAG